MGFLEDDSTDTTVTVSTAVARQCPSFEPSTAPVYGGAYVTQDIFR